MKYLLPLLLFISCSGKEPSKFQISLDNYFIEKVDEYTPIAIEEIDSSTFQEDRESRLKILRLGDFNKEVELEKLDKWHAAWLRAYSAGVYNDYDLKEFSATHASRVKEVFAKQSTIDSLEILLNGIDANDVRRYSLLYKFIGNQDTFRYGISMDGDFNILEANNIQ